MKGLLRKDFYLLWNYSRTLPVLILGFILFSAFAKSGEAPFSSTIPAFWEAPCPSICWPTTRRSTGAATATPCP